MLYFYQGAGYFCPYINTCHCCSRKGIFGMLDKIKEILNAELGIETDDITLDTDFKEDLGADSLDLFELVINLEDEYNLEIPAEELEKISTVGQFIELIKRFGIEA